MLEFELAIGRRLQPFGIVPKRQHAQRRFESGRDNGDDGGREDGDNQDDDAGENTNHHHGPEGEPAGIGHAIIKHRYEVRLRLLE